MGWLMHTEKPLREVNKYCKANLRFVSIYDNFSFIQNFKKNYSTYTLLRDELPVKITPKDVVVNCDPFHFFLLAGKERSKQFVVPKTLTV